METTKKILVIAGLLVASVPLISACENQNWLIDDENRFDGNVLEVSSDGISTINPSYLQLNFVETSELSIDEENLLIELKEEEKLARDVYLAMYEKWGSNIFMNISKAEETHMKSVIRLLSNYGSSDTLVAFTGVFADTKFQDLYDTLVNKGSQSIEEAMGIGALVEEMDIFDINVILDQTDNPNIVMVLGNLEKGSRNHLRSFNKQLSNLGITYSPEYISQSEYEQIISSSIETGNINGSSGNSRNTTNSDKSAKGKGNRNRLGNR
jgi:hypothetical protein